MDVNQLIHAKGSGQAADQYMYLKYVITIPWISIELFEERITIIRGSRLRGWRLRRHGLQSKTAERGSEARG
jgi:hypothetical protein